MPAAVRADCADGGTTSASWTDDGGAGTDADTGTGRMIEAIVARKSAATARRAATGLDSDMG